jgi:hypothetical protein
MIIYYKESDLCPELKQLKDTIDALESETDAGACLAAAVSVLELLPELTALQRRPRSIESVISTFIFIKPFKLGLDYMVGSSSAVVDLRSHDRRRMQEPMLRSWFKFAFWLFGLSQLLPESFPGSALASEDQLRICQTFREDVQTIIINFLRVPGSKPGSDDCDQVMLIRISLFCDNEDATLEHAYIWT